MSLTIDFWQLVGLLGSGLGVLVAVMKFGVAQAQNVQPISGRPERADTLGDHLVRHAPEGRPVEGLQPVDVETHALTCEP